MMSDADNSCWRKSANHVPSRLARPLGTQALAGLLLVLSSCLPAAGQRGLIDAATLLENRVRRASRARQYVLPSAAELRAAEQLFKRTLQGDEKFAALRAAWAELHFDLRIHDPAARDQLWLLCESRGHETGRGYYAFRPTPGVPVVLQAPHSFADRHTRRLTANMLLDSRCAAAAWNTLHRRIVDVAHTESCFFNSLTRAAVRVYRADAVVCQLHGFARSKRTTRAGKTSDLIVSNGTRSPAWWLQRTASSLRELPDVSVRLFPAEVSELGGTTNRQARLIRETGMGKFLHLEMSAELRSTLLSRPDRQAVLLKALERAFRTHFRGDAKPTGTTRLPRFEVRWGSNPLYCLQEPAFR